MAPYEKEVEWGGEWTRGLTMMIFSPNSRAYKGKKERGNMEEFVGRKRGMLTTKEWCNPVSNMV